MLNHPEILIVDDHEAIRTGIRSLLKSRPQWHVCGEAVDGVDAVEKVRALHPDVVLMDISMPRMDGITATRVVQREAPESRVIIVSQNDPVFVRKDNLQADGYVLKVHMHRDLVPAIERVLGSGHNGHGTKSDANATDTTERKETERERVTRGRGHARKMDRGNAESWEQAEQLHELSSRLQQGQDEERRRMARALHDSAGQLIAVLSLNLGQARERVTDDEAVRALEQSVQIVDQLNREIRSMSYLLHPPLLDEAGLSGAIHWYAREIAERASFALTIDVPENFGRLPSDMEVALFRIVQECVTNIDRHSGATTATIRLTCDKRVVRLEVRDNGRGISAEALTHLHRHGVGIAGIRERVRHFGGDMRIDSSGRGTTVSVTLPVPRDFNCKNHESST